MTIHILGLSAYSHDSSAVLLQDGAIVAGAQEERFSRRKFDPAFPTNAARWCLDHAGIGLRDVQAVALVEPPAQRGDADAQRDLVGLAAAGSGRLPPVQRVSRHRAQAASAFLPSPFARAAVLCLDAGGSTPTSAWMGEAAELKPLWTLDEPHSLGLLYSAFTHFCGFAVGAGEYKLMGLAPYGEPRFAGLIRKHLIHIRDSGCFQLDRRYFSSAACAETAALRLAELFDAPPRAPDMALEQRHMDVARSIQVVLEEAVLRLAEGLQRLSGAEHLCLAGGVGLNCVANGRLLREGPFRDIWVQPAAGDAGGAVGAALSVWHDDLAFPRSLADSGSDAMQGCFLGPAYDDAASKATLRDAGAVWTQLPDDLLFDRVAALLAEGKVVGWMQGRMEFGPRALGARSILADPREPGMQSRLNRKIKFRESFRPFAPAVPVERLGDWFEQDRPSPYMLFTAPVATPKRVPLTAEQEAASGLARSQILRSRIPAVTHVDLSARVQSVDASSNLRFHRLLRAFEERTGCPVLVNTSFNVRDEPIVCTPLDAWRCFAGTDLDYLCIGNLLLARSDQPAEALAAAAKRTWWQRGAEGRGASDG